MEEQIAQLQRDVNELKSYVSDRKIQQLTFPLDEVTKKIIGQDDISGETTSIGLSTKLTISGGVITPNSTHHTIDTEGSAATDDLVTITTAGLPDGMILVLQPESGLRDVVLKDNTGNLRLAGDFTMDGSRDAIVLLKSDTSWIELSRSDNS